MPHRTLDDNPAGLPDQKLLEEAADWAIAFQYEAPDPRREAQFRKWHGLSAAHEQAWERARQVFATFGQVPTPLTREVLERLNHASARRRTLRLLAGGAMLLPVGLSLARHQPWREWLSDERTAVGERRTIALPDQSELALNTASAVNISFTSAQRRLQLVAGEILIATQPDLPGLKRPFLVETPYGTVRALGTRFGLRLLEDGSSLVSVFRHAVEITPQHGASRILEEGQQVHFTATEVMQPMPIDENSGLWQQGMLLAQDMRLGDVVAELARYRRGFLNCDPAIAGQRVSGSISLSDTDSALDLLERTLPVRIVRRTSYWVSVQPRG
ncbi:FecR domain-containing protein [Aquamicrobium sp. NLF2-7]|uniref:FecR domain-containing protein n=1 Tax=Aquamicrobium sp. NLF2-7 TaxID=2918753 RepID=UPI001EFC0874|nr:FecR domain-containing protein [Aquamicrobium sp. NLF2-7]MCG8274437.1 FecR domain-containing protein [Aquamicrobium sp. NLF2-7]